MLISLEKIRSPCCRDNEPLYDVKRSHSPIKLKSLEAGGGGDHGVGVFLGVLLFVVGCDVHEVTVG